MAVASGQKVAVAVDQMVAVAVDQMVAVEFAQMVVVARKAAVAQRPAAVLLKTVDR